MSPSGGSRTEGMEFVEDSVEAEEREHDGSVPVRFVRDFVELPLPFEVAAPLLSRQSAEWLGDLASEVTADDAGLRAVLGLRAGLLRTPVAFRIASPRRLGDDELQLPMTWEGAQAPWLFPRLDGLLGVSKVGPELCQLWLEGSYRPPLGRTGLLIDQTLLYRVADATIRRFLEHVARGLVELGSAGT